ncbi:DUF1700 domain-containing protein [Kineothrix sedimenti]|uniref:DUF1700 domain-containing protein n=1 Tax=Kineothrix sedimenti TaxID=3123317 RepID=A0ABZ3EUG4_9FIRM
MNRLEFMQKLESLLSDISDGEREEALQYYNSYLNDAGVENEQEVLESLGTPEKIAKTIKEGLGDNAAVGEFTETGYKDYTAQHEEKNEVIKKKEKKALSGGMIALIVILCILASPLLVSIAGGLISAGVGIFVGVLGFFLGIALAGILLFVTAVVLLVIGIGYLFYAPLAGVCLIGAGLFVGGLSLFFIWLTVWICVKAIPWLIRVTADLIGKLFRKKGGERA